jgi:hypothetical protein
MSSEIVVMPEIVIMEPMTAETAALGEVIREYNRDCNIEGEFTLNRYIEGLFDHFRHTRAGFLGVYGNISGCTVLHGLHACQLCGDSGDCKCVGDDVFGVGVIGETWSKNDLISAVQSLGEVQKAKVKWWPYRSVDEENDDDTSWPYVKRPLDRLENRMHLEQNLFLPIFGLLVPIADGIHDEGEDIHTRVSILGSQTLSLIRQCRQLYPPLDEHQKDLLQQYLGSIYKQMRVPLDGRLPCESFFAGSKEMSHIFMPSIGPDFLDVNPWDLVKHRFETRTSVLVEIPVCSIDREVLFDELLRERGQFVQTCLDRRIVYLEKMEWAVSNPMYQVCYMDFEQYSSFYDSLFLGNVCRKYEIKVLPSAPRWIDDLIHT